MRRVHHIGHGRGTRMGVLLFAGALWLTLGLISQVAFQVIG